VYRGAYHGAVHRPAGKCLAKACDRSRAGVVEKSEVPTIPTVEIGMPHATAEKALAGPKYIRAVSAAAVTAALAAGLRHGETTRSALTARHTSERLHTSNRSDRGPCGRTAREPSFRMCAAYGRAAGPARTYGR